MKETLWRLQ
jgi:hypothetical protein